MSPPGRFGARGRIACLVESKGLYRTGTSSNSTRIERLLRSSDTKLSCWCPEWIKKLRQDLRATRGQCPRAGLAAAGSRPAMAGTAAQTSGNTPGSRATLLKAARPREAPGSGALARGCPPARSGAPLEASSSQRSQIAALGIENGDARRPGCGRPGAPSPDRDRRMGLPSTWRSGRTLAVQRLARSTSRRRRSSPEPPASVYRVEDLLPELTSTWSSSAASARSAFVGKKW